jgi:chloramphenicol O-acetyltransferase type B
MIYKLLMKQAKRLKRIVYGKPMCLQKRYAEYQIGKGTYGNPKVYPYSCGADATLRVGAFCSIGFGVKIFLGGEHRLDWVTTYPFNVRWKKGRGIKGHPKTKGDVRIGNDVFIGAETLILSGVNIGDGAVIGARAVVTKDVPPYAVAVGNPARVVKKRFNEETIGCLLKVKWWDWEDGRIEKALPMLLNSDIGAFLQAAENNEI